MLSLIEREFCGWFWGEGSFDIKKTHGYKNAKHPKPYYQPYISVTQRDDDPDFLYWCKERFGGTICLRSTVSPSMSKAGYKANPRLTWYLGGYKGCSEVVKALEQSVSPAKKRKEMEIFKRFLLTKIGTGHDISEDQFEIRTKMREEMREFKRYKPQ